jgi:hypothetical protein
MVDASVSSLIHSDGRRSPVDKAGGQQIATEQRGDACSLPRLRVSKGCLKGVRLIRTTAHSMNVG